MLLLVEWESRWALSVDGRGLGSDSLAQPVQATPR